MPYTKNSGSKFGANVPFLGFKTPFRKPKALANFDSAILRKVSTVHFLHFLKFAAIAMGASASTVSAQMQRTLENPSFEENDPNGPGHPFFEILPDSSVPGWNSTGGEIEMWDSGLYGVVSADGQVHIELAVTDPVGEIYQNICLTNGEVLTWAFYHRKRAGETGDSTQIVNFEIADNSGTQIQLLGNSSDTDVTSWVFNQSTAGVAYTGPTGVQRVQFSSPNISAYGNFLDGVQLGLTPYVQLNSSTSALEGDGSAGTPSMLITGNLTSAMNVTVQVTGGTATLGDDYTTPSGTNNFTVTIPAGDYSNVSFPLGVTIIDDGTSEADETIDVSIAANPTDYTIASTTLCGGAVNTSAVHTITDPLTDLVTVKTLSSGDATPAEGDTVSFNISVTNNGPQEASSVNLTDILPAGLTASVNNGVVTAGSYAPGTGLWTVGTLANGTSATLTIEGTVNAGQGGNTITNTIAAASGSQTDTSTAGDDLTESVVVDDKIIANDDDFSSTPITFSGGTTASVFADDTINTAGFANDDVTPLLTDADGLTGVSINADGTLTVPSGTTLGTYDVGYQICEVASPSICDTAIATIVVAIVADFSITKTNTPGVNGEVDQASDTVTSGTSTTYTLVVTNNGPDSVTGVVVTDTPGSGLTCPGTNPVTITGDGAPAGSFTLADLTGSGIALAPLANDESATLTFSCQVN